MTTNSLAKVATSTALAPSLSDIAAALTKNALSSPVVPPHSGGTQFVKFDGNTGIATFGKDGSLLPLDQTYVVPLMGLRHGWLYWASAKPEKESEVIVPALLSPFPAKPDNRPVVGEMPKPRDRDGWQIQWSLEMTGMGGEMDGISFDWPGSARGYQQMWSGFVFAIRDRAAHLLKTPEENQNSYNAVVRFETGSYFAGAYRKTIHTPEFIITGWTDGFEVYHLEKPISSKEMAKAVTPGGAAADVTDPLGGDPLGDDVDPLN